MSETSLARRWRAVRGAGRAALIPYLTAGFPTAAASREALRQVVDAGADCVEVGIPFSDPIADGPVIQRACHAALAAGMTVAGVLALVRDAALSVPVVLMTYLNPVLAYGVERFARDALEAGAAALLLTDVPAGADPATERVVRGAGLDLIRLIAPTTAPERLAGAVADGSGFIYLISRLGVTGVREAVPADVATQVGRVRAVTSLPIAVGFGIGTADQARATARVADGVVVGSAVVAALEEGGPRGAASLVRELAGAVREARA